MKREIALGLILVVTSILMFTFVNADDKPHELSQNYTGVQTSNGTVNLYAGNFVGGSPSNYITLIAAATFQTTEGSREFQVGTRIDCDHEPGTPDPCSP